MRISIIHRTLLSTLLFWCLAVAGLAQELDARVTINHSQVQGTSVAIFENLESQITQFINERKWTNLQFKQNERIACNFNITISKYEESENKFSASLAIQCTRPVYNASYTTVTFGMKDNNFSFTFQEFDKLEFRPDVIDNDLTAMIAFYAYLIIGIDLDTMSPLGGTEYLQQAQNIANSAQGLTISAKGWKAFDDDKNRYAIINDYMDSGMESFRKMQYQYYRKGLDDMCENTDRARGEITKAIELLAEAKEYKPLSMLPQLFTEFKRDELVAIYQGKGNASDKEKIYDTLMKINASYSSYWNKLRK